MLLTVALLFVYLCPLLAEILPPDSISLCRNNQHVLGKWINGTRTKKTYYSCSWNNRDYLNNVEQCGGNSRDERLISGHISLLLQSGGDSSMCDARDNTRMTVTQRERYEWEPMLCDLIPWNATQFCELLGNRKILLIGDSTMFQVAGSLASRITWDAEPMKGCAPQISVGRINQWGPDPKFDAFAYINEIKPDIVIFNSGAHQVAYQIFEDDLTRYFQQLHTKIKETYGNNITMVWKTMNPGHVSCPQVSGTPLNIDWEHHLIPADIYHWYTFAHQDRFAKSLARRLHMKVIDMSPLYYRQDAHSDCVHYCNPGPLDLFSVLLLNMLYTREI